MSHANIYSKNICPLPHQPFPASCINYKINLLNNLTWCRYKPYTRDIKDYNYLLTSWPRFALIKLWNNSSGPFVTAWTEEQTMIIAVEERIP